MALGASRGRALWLILRRGLVLSSVGLTLGLLGGVMFTTVLESYLWEVTSTDPATFSTVPMTLGAVSLLACYLAARRVLKIDPAGVFRQQ